MPKDITDSTRGLFRHAVIDGTGAPDTITGTVAADTISGRDGNDVIEAGAGDDSVLGGAGADLINGEAGNDTLDGEAGNDTLVGGAGDDTFVLSEGSDAYFGEQVLSTGLSGRDVLDMGAALSGLDVTFSDVGEGTVADDDDATDYNARFFGIEVVLGSAFDDTITGAGGNDVFEGGAGDDSLAGGAGDDIVTAGAGDDTLVVGTGEDLLAGGDGRDLLTGETLTQAMVLTLTGAGTGALVLDNGDRTDFSGVEAIRGSDFDDVMTGAAGDDILDAGAGDDTVAGGAGNDVLTGGAGNDVIDGGDGIDTAVLPDTPSRAVFFLRADGSLRVLSADGDDIYRNIEFFRFENGVNVPLSSIQSIAEPEPALLPGTDGADTLFGTDQSDVIEAGAGDDSVLGRDGDDLINGEDGNDTLDGEAGRDTLVGGAGDDRLVLSVGRDAYFGGQAGSAPQPATDRDILDMSALTAVTTDAAGVYTLLGANVIMTDVGIGTVDLIDATTDAPREGEENRFFGIEEIVGSDLDDTFAGAQGDDIFAGGAGDDVIDGGAGDDTLSGEGGADTLLASTGDDILSGGAGGDLLSGEALEQAMTVTMSGAGAGSLTLTDGSLTNFTGIETIRGSDLADTLTGAEGDDIFEGGGGNDVISGGAGADTAILSATPSRYDYFLRADGSLLVVANADNPVDTGTDIYTGIETFRFDNGVEVQLSALEAIALPEPEGGLGPAQPAGDDTPLSGVRAPVGDAIASRADPDIGAALFGEPVALSSIGYQGSPDAIGLLPGGYTVTNGQVSIGIENGIFLTTGGGPGETNTSPSFGENLGEPGNDLLDQAVTAAFEEAGGTNDAAVVTFTFDATILEGERTLALDVFFGSEEFPEFVDSSFVDIAAVYVNGVNYALFNNDPKQPLAIVGESISTPGNFFVNGNNDFNTEYDGISALLTVLAPVVDGINTVTIAIADTGDSIYDSGLWVGNLGGSDIDLFGSFVNVAGSQDNDVFDLNIAPQIVDLVGGRDLVRGTLAELDNDVIKSWGDNDRMLFRDVFDPAVFTANADADRAEIVVDTNDDGTPEARLLIFGNFSQAEFFFEAVPGGVQLRTEGVLPDPPVFLTGTDAGEVLFGGTGNDQLAGGAGQDTLSGGEGNDTLAGGPGDDIVRGDFGSDSIGGGPGRDTLYGGESADIIGGGQGRDSVLGGAGDDRISGGADGDLLDGQGGSDTIGGGQGNDAVYGGLGDDSLGGGTGQDSLYGGRGDDTIGGGEGNDLISDDRGSNFLAGGGRDDTIIGGTGQDTIVGGSGNDVMTGGGAADLFVFNTLTEGEYDVITDFEVGVDTIRFTGGSLAQTDISFDVRDDLPGVLLDLGGHEVFLQGLIVSDIDTDDFLFL